MATKVNVNLFWFLPFSQIVKIAIGILFLSYTQYSIAMDWRFTPSLSLREVFSDNLTLANTSKQSGFVTEASPGISVYGNAAVNRFNLNYRAQNLYNAGGSETFGTNHQLQMNSLFQLPNKRLYLQTSSSISQQNLSNAVMATDNISGANNRSTVKNFSISPYWTPRFGNFANGLFQIRYDKSSFDNSNITGQLPLGNSLISDSDSFGKQVNLSSGSKFQKIRWNLSFNENDQRRQSSNNVFFQQSLADIRYAIDRHYNLIGQFGYENNNYSTTAGTVKNGFFYTVGAQWRPSLRFSIEGGLGNNQYVSLQFAPLNNMFMNVTYRHKDIGLNRGDTWNAALHYRAKNLIWGFNYLQDTTTVQQVLQQNTVFNTQNAFGDQIQDPVNQQPLQYVINLPSLVDDVLVRQRADMSLAYRLSKNQFNVSLYNEQRTYQLVNRTETVYGATGSWFWQFAPSLNLYFQPTYQSTQGQTGNERIDFAVGLTRSLAINLGHHLLLNTQLEFRHINQTSNTNFNYIENRATASVFVRF